MKNAFYFMLQTLFVLKIFVGKRLDQKAKVNFKIDGITDCTANN